MGKKQKLIRFERVKHLPNVTLIEFGKSQESCAYPWNATGYEGKKRILELGCGKGEHTLAFAGNNPEWLCVGIDIKSHRICVGAEKAIALGLENVQFLRSPVENLKDFFEKSSIDQIWLTFPDPHFKKRAIKNRLSGKPFLDLYAHLLVPGGMVHLKTDSDLMYDYTQESVTRWGGKILVSCDDLHGSKEPVPGAFDVVSTFENKALAKGRTIKYLAASLG